jgi:hypothetical protein
MHLQLIMDKYEMVGKAELAKHCICIYIEYRRDSTLRNLYMY